jgi:FAD:protein FMN transferase
MMNRRRFLTLTACALASRASATEIAEWQGTGFGAALALRLLGGSPETVRRTFRRVEAEIARIETAYSLHRSSALVRLNRDGWLAWPSDDFRALFTLCSRVHAATAGAFDPTVQPLWLATASDGDLDVARGAVGWDRVRVSPDRINLAPGQALTLNGIAQGWAADRIADLLRREGYHDALIDMGEIQALGHRPDGADWVAGVAATDRRPLGRTRLSNRALATSSPQGTLIGQGQPHILDPRGRRPIWSTVSVSAPEAAVADGLSTAFCLMERAAIDKALAVFPGARLEILA